MTKTLGLRVDWNKVQGAICKIVWIFQNSELFSYKKLCGLGSFPMDHDAAPVHHGPVGKGGGRLVGVRPYQHLRGRSITTRGRKGGGDIGEPV
jgi:hypothetical protein